MIAPGLRVPEFWRRILVFNPSIDIKMVEGRETPRLILYDWNIKNKQTCHRSVVSNSVSSWTVADQAPLSMGFSRQEYWSGLPFSPPGDLPDPGIEPWSPALWADALPSKPPGKPQCQEKCTLSPSQVKLNSVTSLQLLVVLLVPASSALRLSSSLLLPFL